MTISVTYNKGQSVPIKFWTAGVPVEQQATEQLINVASLPFIYKHVAVMPDVHAGMGATIGSVIPTIGAIIPAAVGVDIGCGMCAQRLDLRKEDGDWKMTYWRLIPPFLKFEEEPLE